MMRSLVPWIVAGLALSTAASADAQTMRRVPHHAQVAAHHVVRPGDIVVHARSYLDPGTAAAAGEIGTGNRYVTDSAPVSLHSEGSSWANGRLDFLPNSRFNPPGRPEPLLQF